MVSAGCPYPYPINDAKIVDGTFDNYAIELINARCAWNITQGNPNIIIAIVDMEFDTAHEDLSGQIIYLSGSTSGGNHHGTMVAGAAAAATNNNKGVCGVGYNSKIAAYRVQHSSGGTASSGDIRNAIYNAYDNGQRIINVSWQGTGLSKANAEEITGGGAVLTLSAGNDSLVICHSTIANVPGVIVVSGVDRNNNYHTSFARNQYVDLCAPGVYVAVPTNNNGYVGVTGTSVAAPLVSGTIALMLSVNPNLTPAEIETILKNTAAPINNAHLYPGLLGAGRLDAYAAVLTQSTICIAPIVNFTNKTVTKDTTVTSPCVINVQDVEVKPGATLIIEPEETTKIQSIKVELGAGLKIQ
ncbi:MAG: S8 family serine peptidase [Bacteroidetes bacterium]|nr:S8 family serine peptidase [Bacteroidota bacterium]